MEYSATGSQHTCIGTNKLHLTTDLCIQYLTHCFSQVLPHRPSASWHSTRTNSRRSSVGWLLWRGILPHPVRGYIAFPTPPYLQSFRKTNTRHNKPNEFKEQHLKQKKNRYTVCLRIKFLRIKLFST